jgi:hypothetical protein
LKPGDVVSVQLRDKLSRGVVVAAHSSPRSYVVDTEHGSTLRRNRQQLIATREPPLDTRPPPLTITSSTDDVTPPVTCNTSGSTSGQKIPRSALVTTRSGRTVKPPVRLRDYNLQ